MFFGVNCGRCDRASISNADIFYRCHAVLDFNGKSMRTPKRRKKSKLEKTLEEGDLLFNLVLSIWFFILAVVFGGIFKIFLSYKNAMLAFYSLLSILSINLIFKIVDIYMVYTKESVSDRVQRELAEKRKIKRTL